LIRWIQGRRWLSSSLIALTLFLVFGGIDLILQGPVAVLIASIYGLTTLFAANRPSLSILSLAIATAGYVYFGLEPLYSGAIAAVAVFIAGALASQKMGIALLLSNLLSGFTLVGWEVAGATIGQVKFGFILVNEDSRNTAIAVFIIAVAALNILFWLMGRLTITNYLHVGTRFDQAITSSTHSLLSLEVAEQNERFEIARDISELIIQKVSAVISQAEGAVYAAKADLNSATRSLDKIAQSARGAHTELRRLYDMLNKQHTVSAAPPRISDLNALTIAYREFGYTVSITSEGVPFSLSEGGQLAIYRIVFDALENVKQHCPVGTDVSVSFSWVEEGLQVLVKDNGIEVTRRLDLSVPIEDSGYTVDEDLKALVEPIRGASITAMRERADLYGGSVEATVVPGVGFTLSAIFPQLRTLAGSAEN
jgi:signal transduction histidine kinase